MFIMSSTEGETKKAKTLVELFDYHNSYSTYVSKLRGAQFGLCFTSPKIDSLLVLIFIRESLVEYDTFGFLWRDGVRRDR